MIVLVDNLAQDEKELKFGAFDKCDFACLLDTLINLKLMKWVDLYSKLCKLCFYRSKSLKEIVTRRKEWKGTESVEKYKLVQKVEGPYMQFLNDVIEMKVKIWWPIVQNHSWGNWKVQIMEDWNIKERKGGAGHAPYLRSVSFTLNWAFTPFKLAQVPANRS